MADDAARLESRFWLCRFLRETYAADLRFARTFLRQNIHSPEGWSRFERAFNSLQRVENEWRLLINEGTRNFALTSDWESLEPVVSLIFPISPGAFPGNECLDVVQYRLWND